MRNRNGNGTPQTLGGYVRKLRTDKELSLKNIADKTGKTVGYLSDFERGRRSAKTATLGKIAAALGVSAAELNEVARLERIATLTSELRALRNAEPKRKAAR